MTDRIRYRTNARKALEALVFLAKERPGLSFYYVAKIFYFADKLHLSRYGRPVLGDRYIAMDHGPVPSLIYDLLKANPFLEPDLLDAAEGALDVSRANGHPVVRARRDPNLRLLSRTDIDTLRDSIEQYASASVTSLRNATHRERAYQEASANGDMDYALMIDESDPNRDRLLEEIRQTAPTLAL